MAGAPVGDVPAHRPRGFYAGSTAMNVKARVCAPKGVALTEWPLPARCGQGWAERRKFFFRVINYFGIAPAIHPKSQPTPASSFYILKDIQHDYKYLVYFLDGNAQIVFNHIGRIALFIEQS